MRITSSCELFSPTSGIFSRFDKLNLIDYYLFKFFITHFDGWSRNFFIIRNTAPSKFFLIPWDFDFSFGQGGWGSFLTAQLNQTNQICKASEIYNRLLNNKEFMENCKERWKILREEIWTEEFFSDMLAEYHKEIEEVKNLDYSLWYADKDILELDEYIQILHKWIPKRLEYCDYFFNIQN